MKIKIFIICLILASFTFSQSLKAQGFFEKETTPDATAESISTKAWGDPNENTDQDGEAGSESPIGEGIVLLSLLSGGYALMKKRNSNKKYEA